MKNPEQYTAPAMQLENEIGKILYRFSAKRFLHLSVEIVPVRKLLALGYLQDEQSKCLERFTEVLLVYIQEKAYHRPALLNLEAHACYRSIPGDELTNRFICKMRIIGNSDSFNQYLEQELSLMMGSLIRLFKREGIETYSVPEKYFYDAGFGKGENRNKRVVHILALNL